MIVVMRTNATEEQIERVAERLKQVGLGVHLSRGEFGLLSVPLAMIKGPGNGLEALPFVEQVLLHFKTL